MGIFSGLKNQEDEQIFIGVDAAGTPENNSETEAEAETEAETEVEAEQPETVNNLIWTGKRTVISKETGETERLPRDMPEFVIDGGEIISLPDNLSKGAYLEEGIAARLKSLFPDD